MWREQGKWTRERKSEFLKGKPYDIWKTDSQIHLDTIKIIYVNLDIICTSEMSNRLLYVEIWHLLGKKKSLRIILTKLLNKNMLKFSFTLFWGKWIQNVFISLIVFQKSLNIAMSFNLFLTSWPFSL